MRKKIFPPVLSFVLLLMLSACIAKKPVAKTPRPEVVEVPPTPETPEVDPETREELPVEKPVEETPVVTETPAPEVKKEALKREGPEVPREFRAAWVATVANINWPSKPGLSSKEQQQEAIKLLDLLKENNFNAVIFQVRPQADALYESELEPWSYFLTGEQGKAPEPFYDPLHFWIEAAHDRGLELHAWLNPYRAHHSSGKVISDQSIIKTHPELVVKLENGMYWMDPALEGTKEISTAVVMDLVKRYDLDGIHFDDYFYPYDSYNGGKDFPDDKSWNTYKNAGGELSRADWRRENVNSFIKNIYQEIKAEKPEVKFGLSPFGIWRPGYPESVSGYDQYDKLYADAKLWLNEGWIDYFTPQLYWKVNQLGQSFPVLLGWWEEQNFKDRHLWPGINAGLGGDEKNIDEVINQIMISRGMLPQSPGVVFWSIAPIVNYPNMNKAIVEGPYKKRALVPASPWLDNVAPAAPVVVPEPNGELTKLTWVPGDDQEVFQWVVYFKHGESWNYKILDRKANSFNVSKLLGDKKIPLKAIAVTAVDKTGNESEFRLVEMKP